MSSPNIVSMIPGAIRSRVVKCFVKEDVDCLVSILSEITGMDKKEIYDVIRNVDPVYASIMLTAMIYEVIR